MSKEGRTASKGSGDRQRQDAMKARGSKKKALASLERLAGDAVPLPDKATLPACYSACLLVGLLLAHPWVLATSIPFICSMMLVMIQVMFPTCGSNSVLLSKSHPMVSNSKAKSECVMQVPGFHAQRSSTS